MNEATKTAIFVLLAATLVGGAILSRPSVSVYRPEEMVGKILFPKFTDPLVIKSLDIVNVDAAGKYNDFRIVEVNGIWSIPSHDNYPADATDQMGWVAGALIDLKVLNVIPPDESGLNPIDFQTKYGVIDPDGDSASLGKGVGIKVTLGGANNETLVNMIIGKEVARKTLDTESQDMMDEDESPHLRYVRIVGQSPVYEVALDPRHFSTDFDLWINKNLLDINTLDIKEFYVDEYSFVTEDDFTGMQGKLIPTFIGDITLSYDGEAVGAKKWSLARWMTFEGQNDEYRERQLEADKELDTRTLDDMTYALNDLGIVSVLKKPAEFSSALRKETPFGDIAITISMLESMLKTGFYLVQFSDMKGDSQTTKAQLLSNEGDLQFRLKDGIVYNLRFGKKTSLEGNNRYLFITAEFDEKIIPKPELKSVSVESEAEQELAAIGRANQREQERYDAAVATGKKRAAELTDRFADWYYVISDDVYERIHLTQTNVFRAKKPEGESPWDGLRLPFDTPGYDLPDISDLQKVDDHTENDTLPSE